MQIRLGYELIYECPQPTPMLLMLNVHHTRAPDIVVPDVMKTDPLIPVVPYRDGFGNWCSRIVAPAGRVVLTATGIVTDDGQPDPPVFASQQHEVQDLPDECLQFLLGSRYCEVERLGDIAWSLFGNAATGAARVQAICDYVHQHITFGYHYARSTKTAWDAFNERTGVCRDFAHLAVTFCRCMNIPARYCTGYLGDILIPPQDSPMDFAAWFEAYIGGHWHTYDPRNNVPRVGRVLMARGRDATDVAISTTFGPSVLAGFKVWTDEIVSDPPGHLR
jgi:transglutaminase-like putative cysteine protease